MVLERHRRHWRGDRYALVDRELPAFPRYIFARDEDWLVDAMHSSRERMHALAGGVSEDVVDELRRMVTEVNDLPLRCGDKVKLLASGLTGVVVSLDKYHSHRTVSVLTQMLGSEREISVPVQAIGELPMDDGGSGLN